MHYYIISLGLQYSNMMVCGMLGKGVRSKFRVQTGGAIHEVCERLGGFGDCRCSLFFSKSKVDQAFLQKVIFSLDTSHSAV